MKKLMGLILVLLIVAVGCTPAAKPATTTSTVPVVTTGATTIVPPSTTYPIATDTHAPSATTTTAVTTTPVVPTATAAGTLEQRLSLLYRQLEQQRVTQHIPGMALAVVQNDKIIYTQGFGVSDLEKKTAVTPETTFAIGSTTKAFTSTLVGMLVDEGKMDWNDPVSRYLPYFKMKVKSADPTAEMNLVDAMSHRSGFPRMALLTASGQVPREEALQDASAAEPLAAFRSQFYYSNEMYMSAGVAAGKAGGSDWDTLVSTRILQPLRMSSTTTNYKDAQKDPRLSLGYLWDEDTQSFRLKPLRNVDNIGPAGSINSNALDMAQWLRLQLSNGLFEGKRLISERNLLETRKKQIQIVPGMDYGMGWMLHEWQGQPVIEHGGNVDGFSAEVAFLPDSDLGYVLLTNSSINQLPTISQNMVWETILGDWQSLNPEGAATEFQPYLGKYTANFATFRNETFTVLVQNNRLAIDIPDQMVFELKAPDAAGKWFFTISDQISVSFDRNADGQVTGMKMYQSGATFEIPREGFVIPLEIPLADLQKYLGVYGSDSTGKFTILIQNKHLAFDVPGQMVYELFPPDSEGKWYFRITNQISLKFNTAADGTVESITSYQSGRETVIPRSTEKTLPTVEEILKLHHAQTQEAAMKTLGNLKISGTIYVVQCGIHGSITAYVGSMGQYRINEEYGKYGSAYTSVNGDQAWTKSSFAPFEELHGKLLLQAKQGDWRSFLGDWRLFFDSVQVLRAETLNERMVYVLELKKGSLPAITIYVDSQNGDILQSKMNSLQEGGISVPITTLYENYREVNGLRVAFRETSSNDQSGKVIIEYQEIKTNLNFDNSYFILTP